MISHSNGFIVFGGNIGSQGNTDMVALFANNIWVQGLVFYNTLINQIS